jgi:hypothetical protein
MYNYVCYTSCATPLTYLACAFVTFKHAIRESNCVCNVSVSNESDKTELMKCAGSVFSILYLFSD